MYWTEQEKHHETFAKIQELERPRFRIIWKRPTRQKWIWIISVDMASSPSPLYIFDNQIWEQLLGFVCRQDLCQLVLVGDKRVSAACIQATRSFSTSCTTIECIVLSRAMNTNLKSLKIVAPGTSTSFKNYPHAINMIAHSSLTQLTFIAQNIPRVTVSLPPTLKKLVITCIGDQSLDHISLGEAKLSHLHLGPSRKSFAGLAYCKSLVDNLIMPSAATLEHLVFGFLKPVQLNLSSHSLLTSVSLGIDCLLTFVPFISPPSAKELILTGSTLNAKKIQTALSTFGTTLVDVTLNMSLVSLETLDISSLGHIESLKIPSSTVSIICAPTKHLCITCDRQPNHISNKGPGTLMLRSRCLVLRGGSLPHHSIVDILDWSFVTYIRLDYSTDYPLDLNVDYSPIQRATNVKSISIVSGDTVSSFVARDGPRFLQAFPKLESLEWDMEMKLCASLTASGFVLPPSVTHLRIYTFGFADAPDWEPLNLLDWMKHSPKKLELDNFPFIPKVISLCNDATSIFELEYSCNQFMDVAIWNNNLTLLPSPHVNQASFQLYCANHTQAQVLQRVFGPLYCDPDIHGEISILHTVPDCK